MKKFDVGQTINTVANVGVIAGIVFLAFEVDQNNALMESEARRNRSAYAEQANLTLATDGELGSLLFRNIQGESLSELEWWRVDRFWFAGLTNLETGFFDLTDEELEIQSIRWRRFYETNSILRETWANMSSILNPAFVSWFNEAVLVQPE